MIEKHWKNQKQLLKQLITLKNYCYQLFASEKQLETMINIINHIV